jgi:hypothetical protein
MEVVRSMAQSIKEPVMDLLAKIAILVVAKAGARSFKAIQDLTDSQNVEGFKLEP